LLALMPGGYDLMNAAHLIVFVLAVILLVGLGRRARRRGRRASRIGFWVGGAAGAAGALGTAALEQTPTATRAFVADLATHGVPPAAALTLHGLHLYTATGLTALLGGGGYALLGAVAAWWGSRTAVPSPPPPRTPDRPRPKEDRAT
jgi:hypothetical protein